MSEATSDSKVCLITGVGPGTGAALARRFARAGYRVAMLARTAERLEALARELPEARAFACDVADPEALKRAVEDVRATLGAPKVVVHNAVGGTFADFLEAKPEDLERNFQVNVMALFHLARLTVPAMMEAGEGALICTGNTSAYRGKPRFAAFAPTKAAQRVLLESIARRVGPAGVHAAYVAVDAVIDVPWTRQMMKDQPDAFFCKPEDIAEECLRIAHQARSAWSFHVEIRPFGETW
jgi:NAD(P)-dependent dehydrogenase (short-subunit alcohol dehydrogenase family)